MRWALYLIVLGGAVGAFAIASSAIAKPTAGVSATPSRVGGAVGQPIVVSLAGAGGLRIGMTVEEARHRLAGRVPIVVTGGGSSRWLFLPICIGKTEGVAEFSAAGEADGSYTYLKGDGFLLAVQFSAGAATGAGVGIGATRAEVVRAYGDKLERDSWGDLLLIGTPQRYAGRTATPVVIFVFGEGSGVVETLGYGAKQSAPASSDTASC